MTPAISFVAREFVKQRLLDTANDGFNGLIVQTAALYGVPSFELTLNDPTTLWLGRYDLPSVIRAGGAVTYPAVVISTAKSDMRGKQAMRVTPATFSGPVLVSVDFYVEYANQGGFPPDGEAMYSAIEDAFVGAFNTQLSYGLMPGGLTYNNEVIVEQGRMEFDGTRWLQLVACGLDMYRIA